jgi:GH24 family phage-related lysozyme (muramidase)
MANTINAATLALNTASEKCCLLAYDDKRPEYVLKPGDTVQGTLSIGYGHTGPDVYVGQTCTPDQADAWRLADMGTAEAAVAKAEGTLKLTDNQFGALSDFVYNIGVPEFTGSTVRKLLVRGKLSLIPAEFAKWRFSKGVVMAGLVKRRALEAHLFMTPDTQPLDFGPADTPSITPDAVQQKNLLTSATAVGIVAATTIPLLAQPLQDTATQMAQFQDVAPFIPKACHYVGIGAMCCALWGKLRSIRQHNGTAAVPT